MLFRSVKAGGAWTNESLTTNCITNAPGGNPPCNNPAGLASADIGRWVANLHTQINEGACGSIQCTAAACTVGVRWDDSRATGGGTAQVVSMKAQL